MKRNKTCRGYTLINLINPKSSKFETTYYVVVEIKISISISIIREFKTIVKFPMVAIETLNLTSSFYYDIYMDFALNELFVCIKIFSLYLVLTREL